MLPDTVLDSAGQYANLGEWPMVGRFTGLTVATATLLVAMWDGRFDLLVETGIVGVAITVAIVAALPS